MPREFIDLKDGQILEPYHINIIYRELRRLRRTKAVPPMVIDGLESSDSPWVFRSGSSGVKIYRAKVTTAIPTGTITTPSTAGRVTIYDWDGATSTAGETGVKVLNDFTLSASVPVNTIVKIADIDGDMWLIASECY